MRRAIRYSSHTLKVYSLLSAERDSVRDGLTKAQILLSEELLPGKLRAAAAGEVLLQRCAAQSPGPSGLLPAPPRWQTLPPQAARRAAGGSRSEAALSTSEAPKPEFVRLVPRSGARLLFLRGCL